MPIRILDGRVFLRTLSFSLWPLWFHMLSCPQPILIRIFQAGDLSPFDTPGDKRKNKKNDRESEDNPGDRPADEHRQITLEHD